MNSLMYAAKYGHQEVVKLLLEHNADVEAKDNDGRYYYIYLVIK